MANKSEIIKRALDDALDYKQYRELLDNLLAQGKSTGSNNSEAMLRYTFLNIQRMDKWDKHFKVDKDIVDSINSLEEEIWLVITEGWCGDAAHNIPVLHKLTKDNPAIELKMVLRDEHPELMDLYLTNGTRSIPILIRLRKNDLSEIGKWGPRPKAVQDMVIESKRTGVDHDEYIKAVQIWYSRNKGEDMQKEIGTLVTA